MAERNVFLSQKQLKITDMDKFYEYGGEVVMKRKEFNDKANQITSTVILEYISKGGRTVPCPLDRRQGRRLRVRSTCFRICRLVCHRGRKELDDDRKD